MKNKNNNVILRLLMLCVLAGWTAAALGAPPSVLYQENFDDGMTGTIWLQGQGGSTWNPYFSGGPNGTPPGSMALYHMHNGAYCPISYQSGDWAMYWSRPSNSWQGWEIAVPAGTNHVEISVDAWRSSQGWTVFGYFQVAVDFTDPVTYPREWVTPNGTIAPGVWQTFSASATYTGDKVVADISMYQVNTQIYNKNPGSPLPPAGDGVWIDNLLVAYDNLKIVVSGPPQNCDEAIAQGYEIEGDLTDDCKVDFDDIESLAGTWLDCMVPGEAGCLTPWQP